MRGLGAMAAVMLTATPASAEILWQKAEIGDSVATVKGKYPDAVPGSEKDRLADGSQCSLSIAQLEVAQTKFRVCFYFLGDRLNQVTLGLAEPKHGRGAELAFDAILEVLRSKYGAENHLTRDRGLMTDFGADWYRSPVNINLVLIYVGSDDDAVLNINYQTRVAADAAKL